VESGSRYLMSVHHVGVGERIVDNDGLGFGTGGVNSMRNCGPGRMLYVFMSHRGGSYHGSYCVYDWS
jgi:hypothetical protein